MCLSARILVPADGHDPSKCKQQMHFSTESGEPPSLAQSSEGKSGSVLPRHANHISEEPSPAFSMSQSQPVWVIFVHTLSISHMYMYYHGTKCRLHGQFCGTYINVKVLCIIVCPIYQTLNQSLNWLCMWGLIIESLLESLHTHWHDWMLEWKYYSTVTCHAYLSLGINNEWDYLLILNTVPCGRTHTHTHTHTHIHTHVHLCFLIIIIFVFVSAYVFFSFCGLNDSSTFCHIIWIFCL